MIYGIATSPISDRQNEIITSGAMEEAIPSFMKLPILHVDHTERPIGDISVCRVLKKGDPIFNPGNALHIEDAKIGDTYFEAYIRDDSEGDDVWQSIMDGRRNKISIFGARTKKSSACDIPPYRRSGAPCVTDGIRLWSFSLVGENAINPNSYIKIAKSFSPNLCKSFMEKTLKLIKAADCEYNMAPVDQQKSGAAVGNTDDDDTIITKSEFNPIVEQVSKVQTDVQEIKTGMSDILNYIKKSSDEEEKKKKKHEESETKEEEKVEEEAKDSSKSKGEVEKCGGTVKKAGDDTLITKAMLEPTIDLIVKAKVDSVIGDIKKAYDEKISALEKKIEAYSNETIQKGGHMVFLNQDGSEGAGVGNSFLANSEALKGI